MDGGSDFVRCEYDTLVENLDGDYIDYRWKNPVKVHEYNQTRLAIQSELRKRGNLKKVLEVGCGPGTWTDLLAEKSDMLVAVDISKKMLDLARNNIKHHNTLLVCNDVLDLELNEKFDAIYCIRSFEYFDDKLGYIDKFKSMLDSNGRIGIITKNKNYLPKRFSNLVDRVDGLEKIVPSCIKTGLDVYSNELHSDMVSPRELKYLLEEEGFTDIQIYPVILGFFPSHLSGTFYEIFYRIFDRVHQELHKKPMNILLSPFMESYLITGVIDD